MVILATWMLMRPSQFQNVVMRKFEVRCRRMRAEHHKRLKRSPRMRLNPNQPRKDTCNLVLRNCSTWAAVIGRVFWKASISRKVMLHSHKSSNLSTVSRMPLLWVVQIMFLPQLQTCSSVVDRPSNMSFFCMDVRVQLRYKKFSPHYLPGGRPTVVSLVIFNSRSISRV